MLNIVLNIILNNNILMINFGWVPCMKSTTKCVITQICTKKHLKVVVQPFILTASNNHLQQISKVISVESQWVKGHILYLMISFFENLFYIPRLKKAASYT